MAGAVRPPRGALVLGADYRALGVVRSLGRRGIPVAVIAEPAEPLARVSRYARRSLRWPSEAPEDRVALLHDLARRDLRDWALIPSGDESAALVSRHHAELGGDFVLSLPAWDVVRWAYDKRLTYELADRAGVPRPRTERPGSAEAARTTPIDYPALLKPAVKDSANALTTAKAWRVETPEDLATRFAEAARLVDPDVLLVQETVAGGGEGQYSYAALCRAGTPLAALTARRTRQYPADLGRASTFVETVDCPEAADGARRLLAELGYTGLIEVEFKRDPADGVLKLLDVNPRVWGWHTLGRRAGVDFPWLLWRMLRGERVPATEARPGVGWLRVTTDTPTALRELLGRRLALREYARSLRGPRERAIFAWDDPLPGVAEVPVLCYVAARRALRGEVL